MYFWCVPVRVDILYKTPFFVFCVCALAAGIDAIYQQEVYHTQTHIHPHTIAVLYTVQRYLCGAPHVFRYHPMWTLRVIYEGIRG